MDSQLIELVAQIGSENQKVQSMASIDGPIPIEVGYERLQKLVWDLKQTRPKSPTVNRVWTRLVDIGNSDLRHMRTRYQHTQNLQAGFTETCTYINAHNQLKETINQTILLLF